MAGGQATRCGNLLPVSSRVLFPLVGVFFALISSVGRADPLVAIRIELDAPFDCAQTSTVYAAIRARTSRVVEVPSGQEEYVLRVQVGAEPNTNRVAGELRLRGRGGESDTRRVVGESCTEVVDALGLTIALALDPFANTTSPPPVADAGSPPAPVASAAPPLREEPSPVSTVIPPDEPRDSAEPTPAVLYDATAGAGLATARILRGQTSWGPVVHARLGVRTHGWRPSAHLAFLHLRNDWSGPAAQVATRASLIQISLCPHGLKWGEILEIRPAVVANGGWLSATGQDVDIARSVVRPLWQLGAEIGGVLSVAGPLALEIDGGVWATLVSRRFTLQDPPVGVGQTPTLARFARFSLLLSL